jgi:hypothetical protein
MIGRLNSIYKCHDSFFLTSYIIDVVESDWMCMYVSVIVCVCVCVCPRVCGI